MPITCLSIRQPWAWLIVHGYKDIENRDWNSHFRGRFYIHASKGMTVAEYDQCKLFVMRQQAQKRTALFAFPPRETLERGAIVGRADMIGCVTESTSPWFFGTHGFQLANAEPITPCIPCVGVLGFFQEEIDAL